MQARSGLFGSTRVDLKETSRSKKTRPLLFKLNHGVSPRKAPRLALARFVVLNLTTINLAINFSNFFFGLRDILDLPGAFD
jgi:hypothetical protein